jgi:MoaA/NifB/PqqE/SkfB family radical SAM enzyme
VTWASHPIDGGLLRFDRTTGTNVLRRGPSTRALCREAPRTLQVGLLTPCNLKCAFCYRDASAPSTLTPAFLVDLLRKAAEWGVLEVAFGGGEPLLFRGFDAMLTELHATTRLGLGFTTNGTLLDSERIDRLRGVVTEIRVSAYADNRYRSTLRRLRGVRCGVNWLVTPENVGAVAPYVLDFLEQGAHNVLLLGYKGPDASLHLRAEHFDVLRRALVRLEGLPLRLDVCWHPRLGGVAQMFPRSDCGAGDEFLVITPDRAVQACSFASGRIPFQTFEDLRRIYRELRALRPAAQTEGCTRSLFSGVAPPGPAQESAWVWRAFASNNSGDWTIAARFCDEATAQRVAASLRELARAHEAFLASPEGEAWNEEHDYSGSLPTPALRRFGEAHGFDWSQDGDGLWWEENGCGAPVLTAGAIGDAVVVFHPYCMGLPEKPFAAFFAKTGAREFGYWQYRRPRVVLVAEGRNELAERHLREHIARVGAAEYASDVKEDPPWGRQCTDARVRDDEDRNATLETDHNELSVMGQGIRLTLSFSNTFAGALAVAAWLKESGYRNTETSVEPVLRPLGGGSGPVVVPQTGLFGDVRPLAERLVGATPERTLELVFETSSVGGPMQEALRALPPDRVAALGRAVAATYEARGMDVTHLSLKLMESLPPSPERTAWARALWERRAAPEFVRHPGMAVRALRLAFSADEAFREGSGWYASAAKKGERHDRLAALGLLKDVRILDLLETLYAGGAGSSAPTTDMMLLAADIGLPWPRARRWLERGRPLSLIALDVLALYAKDTPLPAGFDAPSEHELREVLKAYVARDDAPRPRRAAQRALEGASRIAREAHE